MAYRISKTFVYNTEEQKKEIIWSAKPFGYQVDTERKTITIIFNCTYSLCAWARVFKGWFNWVPSEYQEGKAVKS
jgi:hypothetical protein